MIVRAKFARAAVGRSEQWLSLSAHAFAVSSVFEALLKTRAIGNRFAFLLGRTLTGSDKARLCLFAYLHDIGKTNTGFQSKLAGSDGLLTSSNLSAGHIRETIALFDKFTDEFARAFRFEEVLTWFGGDEQALSAILIAMLSHHGRPVANEVLRTNAADYSSLWKPLPGYDPVQALADHCAEGQGLYRAAFALQAAPLKIDPPFVHFFAGVLQLADWIGSDEDYFPLRNGEPLDCEAIRIAAARAVREIGLDVEAVAPTGIIRFGDLFCDADGRAYIPSAIQLRAGEELDAPVFLIESETGSGKTEAALWRFAKLFDRGDVDSLYFALPTRVAATQIFRRTRETGKKLFRTDTPGVLLAVPGQAQMDDDSIRLLPDPSEQLTDTPDRPRDYLKWTAERPKRFLAARMAVGTIDQALLSALKVKHAHLRHACLARSLLVIDEVHASDLYQTTLTKALLANHVRAGGKALLMSATLGSAARNLLLQLDGNSKSLSVEEERRQPYPGISTARKGPTPCDPITETVDRRHSKRVRLETTPIIASPSAIARAAGAAAERGAKVLIIRNTVAAAQETQRELEAILGENHPALFRLNSVATLHHGRFAKDDRAALDKAVEDAFGKRREEGPRVVVGTQTLEVSLDLDADYLITDLCPVDVLLQRIGRVHRHQRVRPSGYEKARCVVLVPAERDVLNAVGRHGLGGKSDFPGIYSNLAAIEATWRLLEREPEWLIPAMNRRLVEDATHPHVFEMLIDELAARNMEWRTAYDKALGRDFASRKFAEENVCSTASDRFEDENFSFPEDEQKILTRLGADSRTMLLPATPTGPFGIPITEISLPGHWKAACAALPEDGKVETIAPYECGFMITLGDQALIYDRFGLRLRG